LKRRWLFTPPNNALERTQPLRENPLKIAWLRRSVHSHWPQRAEKIVAQNISRQEVIMPGGVELTKKAEQHMGLGPSTIMLSVACGNGELELYLAEKYKCHIVGIDADEGFIRSAREKTATRKLDDLA
jgi:ubiquinone/menaquinone biosynthesis C-methylase UbiE